MCVGIPPAFFLPLQLDLTCTIFVPSNTRRRAQARAHEERHICRDKLQQTLLSDKRSWTILLNICSSMFETRELSLARGESNTCVCVGVVASACRSASPCVYCFGCPKHQACVCVVASACRSKCFHSSIVIVYVVSLFMCLFQANNKWYVAIHSLSECDCCFHFCLCHAMMYVVCVV